MELHHHRICTIITIIYRHTPFFTEKSILLPMSEDTVDDLQLHHPHISTAFSDEEKKRDKKKRMEEISGDVSETAGVLKHIMKVQLL